MKATVNWNGGMAFTGVANSGFAIQMDADLAVGGSNRGVRPMEMIAMGLASCAAMDVISILQKKRQNIIKFEVNIDAPRSHDHPQVFTSALITYIVTGRGVDEAAVLRAIELSATKYCPVQAILEQAFPIEMHYEIYEQEDGETRRLTHFGAWHELTIE
jgi:putative redox protein